MSITDARFAVTEDQLRERFGEMIFFDFKMAWQRKEDGVAHDDSYDISPQVLWLDEAGDFLLGYVCPQVQRDQALCAIQVMTRAMRAETVVLSVDAHVASAKDNPATGKPWGPGEMQRACNEDGACDLGLITDCIWSMVASRGGRFRGVNRTYHVNHEAKQVHWQTLVAPGEDQALTGLVPDAIEMAFSMPDPTDDIAPPKGMSASEALLHRRVAAMRLVMAINGGGGFFVIPPEDVPDAKEIIKYSLSEEAIREFVNGPLGPLVAATRARYEIA